MKSKNQTTTQAALDEGEAAASRFKDFVKQVISVPKEEIDKREVEYQTSRAKKQVAKNKTKKSA